MRILIVEDEEKLASSLKKILESESYAVDTAPDGELGLDMALSEDYDLIILDLGLPKMDGVAVCRELRAEGVDKPVLMLTARDSIKDKTGGLDTGADDYLVKPFVLEELLARIRSLLRRSGGTKEIILKSGSLIVDPVSKSVSRAGKEIRLTAKEFGLLEYLMRRKGQIIGKQQLLEHVWDMNADPFSNVVDVYIGYLRNKIDKEFPKEKPLITTFKGMGYKIENQ